VTSWVAMHLTMSAILLTAENTVFIRNNGLDLSVFGSSSATGDDLSFTNKEVYDETLSIMNTLCMTINYEKSFSCDSNDGHPLFGEYLKKFVYGGNIITPMPPRTWSKFITSPNKQIYAVVESLTFNGFDFNLKELVSYASLFEHIFNRKVDDTIDQHHLSVFDHFSWNIFFKMFLDQQSGGYELSSPEIINHFGDYLGNQLVCSFPVNKPILWKIAKVKISKIAYMIKFAKSQIKNVIASLASDKMLSKIIKTYNVGNLTNVAILDELKNPKNEVSESSLEKFVKNPIYVLLIKIMIEQHVTILENIKVVHEQLVDIEQNAESRTTTVDDIESLKTINLNSRKLLSVMTMEQVFGNEVQSNEVQVFPISRSIIQNSVEAASDNLTSKDIDELLFDIGNDLF